MAKAAKPQAFGIENLPRILNFEEKRSSLLLRIHQQIVHLYREQGEAKAEVLARRYEQVAQEEVIGPAAAQEPSVAASVKTRARTGLLISLAQIWREAGAFENAWEALDRAIVYARQNRWASIVTVLENEKNNLMPSSL